MVWKNFEKVEDFGNSSKKKLEKIDFLHPSKSSSSIKSEKSYDIKFGKKVKKVFKNQEKFEKNLE